MKESIKEIEEKEEEQINQINKEKTYGLSEDQKIELDKIINENKNFDWMRLNIYKKEDLDGFLEACKNYIFQNEERKNKIMKGNLNFILKISEAIRQFKPEPEPETSFILFKEVFNLYQSGLEQDYIIKYTNLIIEFIRKYNKDKIVLSNFDTLFEVLIYLKVNQIQVKQINQDKMKKTCDKLDELLKSGLQSDEMKIDNKYIDTFFKIINIKLTSQQYVILNLLADYLDTICEIEETKDNLKIFHGILKPIFQLQMDKNADVAKRALECYKKVNKIKNNFFLYYHEDKKLMDEIFLIGIEESYQRNNKINYKAWKLLDVFFKKWKEPEIAKSPQNIHRDLDFKSTRPLSETKSPVKKRGSIHKSIEGNKNKMANLNIITNENIKMKYIPFYLFPKVISLILKSFEYSKDIIEKYNFDKSMIEIIRAWGKTDIFNKDVVNEILKAMKNKKINKKENLKPLLEFTFDIYINNKYEEFTEFCNNYIELIPLEDTNDFILFQELLLQKGFINTNKNSNEFILEILINKIINTNEIINKEKIYKSIGFSIDNYLKDNNRGINDNMLYFFEIIAKVLDKISNAIIENNNVEKEQKNDNDKSKINLNNIINFEEKMVCVLTDLLLEKNTLNFRNSFLDKKEKERDELFSKLYSIWTISPISVLLLCIVTEKFELAYNIILNLKNIKFTDDFYKKLGKLVESFDEENYEYFWQKLLAPSENIFFIKTLFGILMILPQGVAFDYLSDKLSNVQTLLRIEDEIDEEDMIKRINLNKKEIEDKINIFLQKQEKIKS